MNTNNFCIIMAGGVGSRFWPISRSKKPKQFLDILGTGKSLLQQTFERFKGLCPTENIFIVTNQIYVDIVAEQIPEIEHSQILGEPARKNTAPCIAYANLKIKNKNPNANIVVAPSDHLILKEEKFKGIIKQCLEFASKNDSLITLGIDPNRPETGYGYIQISDEKNGENYFLNKVKSFTEKPDKKTAQMFLDSGEFFWNSGIFIWSLKSINKSFKRYLPEIYGLFSDSSHLSSPESEKHFIEETYSTCQNISIDNGIMEHAENVYVHCTEIGWSDLGTWDSLYENSNKIEKGNVVNNDNVLLYDTKNSIINISGDKLAVVEGLEDYILVESENVILICKRDNEKKIREFVKDVEDKKGDNFI